MRSLIVITFEKNEARKKKIKRLKEIAKHFDFRKIDKTKFTLALLADGKERTQLWVQPQNINLENLLQTHLTQVIEKE